MWHGCSGRRRAGRRRRTNPSRQASTAHPRHFPGQKLRLGGDALGADPTYLLYLAYRSRGELRRTDFAAWPRPRTLPPSLAPKSHNEDRSWQRRTDGELLNGVRTASRVPLWAPPVLTARPTAVAWYMLYRSPRQALVCRPFRRFAAVLWRPSSFRPSPHGLGHRAFRHGQAALWSRRYNAW